jgi:hypothetical protein
MQKKLPFTPEEQVPDGSHTNHPHVLRQAIAEGYREMAADEEREREAREWIEAVIGDVTDDSMICSRFIQ